MGGTKITQQDIMKLITSKDGVFISEKTVKSRRIITIKCNKDGNIWETPLHNLKKGKWCKTCFDNKHNINRKKILTLVNSKGYNLLTSGKLNRTDRFRIKCIKHDLEWETCYGNLKYANGDCKLCSSNFPDMKTIKDFVSHKNGEFIEKIKNSEDKRNILIRCIKHNHTWKTRWYNLQKGIWCKKCAIDNKIIKYEEIKALVESKDAVLLTKNCSSAKQKLRVKCLKDNYEWETTWARINQNCWCPRCSGKERYTIGRVRDLLEKKGGKLLDNHIHNVKQKISVECNCGNIFSSSLYHIISHGLWCQLCDLSNSTQKRLYKIIKELFPNCRIGYNNRSFDWLKTKPACNQRMEIDIWVSDIKLAIEYDGEQHFKPVRFANSMTKEQAIKVHKEIQLRDKKKTKLIAQHPNEIKYFVRFNYKETINKELVLDKLIANGIRLE